MAKTKRAERRSKAIVVGAAIMMSFLSKIAISRSFDGYYYLSENAVKSENYEVVKLINGDIDAVLHIEGTNTILVMAAGYLWKINEHGYVIDTLRGTAALHSSGVQLWTSAWSNSAGKNFWYKRFSDWVYTGDKSERTIRATDIEDTSGMSDAALRGYLDRADIVEFFSFYKKNEKKLEVCLTRKDNRWSILDITNRLGRIDERCTEYEHRTHKIWSKTCAEGYERKYKSKVIRLSSRLPFKPNWEDKSQPIFMRKFTRDMYYFEDEFGGWLIGNILGRTLLRGMPGKLPESYWYGTGYFQINHRSEQLKFKAFVSKEADGINFDNISIYDSPESRDGDTKFIEITYRGAQHNWTDKNKKLVMYHEKEVGFYALRKKRAQSSSLSGDADITSGQREINQTPWQVTYTGMASQNPVWGHINLLGEEKTHHYLLDTAAVPVDLNAIPHSMSFNWQGKNTGSAFKLYFNETEFAWHYMHGDNSDLSLDLILNEAETSAAFRRLDGQRQPLRLDIQMEEIIGVGASLSIWLRNGRDAVRLEKVKFEPKPIHFEGDEAELKQRFEHSKVKIEFKRALTQIFS